MEILMTLNEDLSSEIQKKFWQREEVSFEAVGKLSFIAADGLIIEEIEKAEKYDDLVEAVCEYLYLTESGAITNQYAYENLVKLSEFKLDPNIAVKKSLEIE